MNKDSVFLNAEAFHKIAFEIRPKDLFEDADDCHWFIPSVVNLAFSCELYLKYLLIYQGIDYGHTHNLEDLFFLLPENIQCNIQFSKEFKDDEDFSTHLHDYNCAFNDWRYCFEDKPIGIDVVFFDNFSSVLHKIAKNIFEETK